MVLKVITQHCRSCCSVAHVSAQIIVVTLISYLVNFAARFEVKVVGFIPTGCVS